VILKYLILATSSTKTCSEWKQWTAAGAVCLLSVRIGKRSLTQADSPATCPGRIHRRRGCVIFFIREVAWFSSFERFRDYLDDEVAWFSKIGLPESPGVGWCSLWTWPGCPHSALCSLEPWNGINTLDNFLWFSLLIFMSYFFGGIANLPSKRRGNRIQPPAAAVVSLWSPERGTWTADRQTQNLCKTTM